MGSGVMDCMCQTVANMLIEANKVTKAFGRGGGERFLSFMEEDFLMPVKLQEHADVRHGSSQ